MGLPSFSGHPSHRNHLALSDVACGADGELKGHECCAYRTDELYAAMRVPPNGEARIDVLVFGLGTVGSLHAWMLEYLQRPG